MDPRPLKRNGYQASRGAPSPLRGRLFVFSLFGKKQNVGVKHLKAPLTSADEDESGSVITARRRTLFYTYHWSSVGRVEGKTWRFSLARTKSGAAGGICQVILWKEKEDPRCSFSRLHTSNLAKQSQTASVLY